MKFSILLLSTLTVAVIAAPVQKRGVLGTKTYDELSISGGVAGDAEQEALDVFSALDLTDMASIDQEDIDFLGAVNDIANDAETDAFNVAIAAASGDEKTALENGKRKNKVLKLTATSLQLQIQAAQGKDTAAKLAAETKKLQNNIKGDKAAAGEESTKLAFDASA